jgi:hypothetical protein
MFLVSPLTLGPLWRPLHSPDHCFGAACTHSSLTELVEHYTNELLCENLCLEHPVRPEGPVVSSRMADASTPSGGAAVVAVQAFSGDGPNELSCSQGERLTVINDDDPTWLYCSKALGKVIGFVPRGCVRDVAAHVSIEVQAEVRARLPVGFQRSRWIHGTMDRHEAELLLKLSEPGAFLVRESGDTPGNYSLSFRGPRKIQHFRITRNGPNDYELGGRSFSCLEAIVLRYHAETLMDETTLSMPIESTTPPADDGDDDMTYSTVQTLKGAPPPRAFNASASAAPPQPPPAAAASSSLPGLGAAASALQAPELPPPRNTESSSPKPLPSYQQIDTLLRKATVKGMGQVPGFIGSTAAGAGALSPGAAAAVQGGDVIGGAGHVAVDEASLPLKTGWIVKKVKRGKTWKLFFFVLDASTRRLQVNRACTPLLSTASAQCSCLNPNSVLRGRCSVQTQGLTLFLPFTLTPNPNSVLRGRCSI